MRWVHFSYWVAVIGIVTVSGPGQADDKVGAANKAWAYQTPVRPALPSVKHKAWVRNPIDSFILARLEEEKLTPHEPADRLSLLRRVTFDLTGLPPTPEEIQRFLQDPAADAYEKVVERLLASPRFGERMALSWLDLVRYAESDGFRADEHRPNAWRYRDYVIDAFNHDKPYDRFIREQLAGDEFYPGDPAALVATAFNRHFPWEHNARLLDLRRQEMLNDMTDTTTQVFMGLTYGCARCHDHKYDPISQKDYYRLQAFFAAFWPRENSVLPRPEDLAGHQKEEQDFQTKTGDLQKRMRDLEEPYRKQLVYGEKLKFPQLIQEAYDTPAEQRTPLQVQLADLIGRQLKVNADQMSKAMKPEVRKEWQELSKQMDSYAKLRPKGLGTTLAISDIGPVAPATYLLQRGDWRRQGEELEPGFLSIIDTRKPAITPTRQTTGRRSALANWLTSPEHPLTARVMVNRLWHHHFGRGIVATPSDFGLLGDQPTHPELLDWLAREFSEGGWSLKAMHRLMVTSATYRQSAMGRPEVAKIDPDNHLVGRMNRRRLEGETMRDALLAVSGLLNLKAGGPSIFPELPGELGGTKSWPVSADAGERNRRSVYVFLKRNLRYPLFTTFDAPDSNETCARRHVSTSAPQALMLLNDKLILDMVRAFAGRILRESAVGEEALVDRAYRRALGRAPDERERILALDFLRRSADRYQQRDPAGTPLVTPVGGPDGVDPARGAALVDLCHVLVNLNEFLYVD